MTTARISKFFRQQIFNNIDICLFNLFISISDILTSPCLCLGSTQSQPSQLTVILQSPEGYWSLQGMSILTSDWSWQITWPEQWASIGREWSRDLNNWVYKVFKVQDCQANKLLDSQTLILMNEKCMKIEKVSSFF